MSHARDDLAAITWHKTAYTNVTVVYKKHTWKCNASAAVKWVIFLQREMKQ